MTRAWISAWIGAAILLGLTGSLLVSRHDEANARDTTAAWQAAVIQPEPSVGQKQRHVRRVATIYVTFDVGPERIERRLRLTYRAGAGHLALITKPVGVRGVPSSPRCVRARFSVPSNVLLIPLAQSLVDAASPQEQQLKESVYLPPKSGCRPIPIEVDL